MLRRIVLALEVIILSALILATRCVNYQDVFVRGNVYFTDADCYARMTRVRMVTEHPGLIIRHHDFENFPQGTAPHTTAPLDYLIGSLSILLRPFTSQPVDLAGAIISPLFALVAGWFLWWWTARMKFRYRWSGLILFAVSPILVQGTELGRPDHQSLLILLIAVAICAEWKLHAGAGGTAATTVRNWSIVSGLAWGISCWISLYEPLLLLVLMLMLLMMFRREQSIFAAHRRFGWVVFAVTITVALLIEQRLPSISLLLPRSEFQNWSRTIGELAHVSVFDRVWFAWFGYLIVIAPLLIWICWRRSATLPRFIVGLLSATFLLTMWQARWSYFFGIIFALAMPALFLPIKTRAAVWVAFILSIMPILQYWDARLWPDQAQLAAWIEQRNESADLRQMALAIRAPEKHAFLAPWWLSPSISYWSRQPGVAGSSHEALDGTIDSARFFLVEEPAIAREILQKHHVDWVFAYDWERVGENSGDLLHSRRRDHSIGRILDRAPAHAPVFLQLFGQNQSAKLFRFEDKL